MSIITGHLIKLNAFIGGYYGTFSSSARSNYMPLVSSIKVNFMMTIYNL